MFFYLHIPFLAFLYLTFPELVAVLGARATWMSKRWLDSYLENFPSIGDKHTVAKVQVCAMHMCTYRDGDFAMFLWIPKSEFLILLSIKEIRVGFQEVLIVQRDRQSLLDAFAAALNTLQVP